MPTRATALLAMERGGSSKGGSVMAVLLAAFLLVGHMASVQGVAGPSLASDVFISPCTVPEEGAYKLWSSPATWPGGVVPGIGAAVGANATIPCDVAVLLDVPNVTLAILQVKGYLRFKDRPSLPYVSVKANHILVEGKLSIGTFENHFSQKAIIELTPSPGRAALKFTSFEPANETYFRSLGHKAFAVVGGQVDLHGMPQGSDTPSWCQLSVNARVNDASIVVDNPLAIRWPVGGKIVLATSDYSYLESEQLTIKSVANSPQGVIINVYEKLVYNHQGELVDDGMGGTVDERAEVILLTRHIVVTGTDEPAFPFEGGHFTIFQTPIPQYIEGVEFYKMGQQGILGRYSIHFHVVGKSPLSVVRKNAINQAKQRCIVIQATHQVNVERNVAFNCSGHCFSLEEGGEQNNTFLENVGISSQNFNSLGFTDNNAATFRISAPSNTFRRNRAIGSLNSGFWLEAITSVRGDSLDLPELAKLRPLSTPLLEFVSNVAHSCHDTGLKTFPNGYKPPRPSATSEGSHFKDMLLYKHSNYGAFLHLTSSIVLSGTFADNQMGVWILESASITIKNSRFVGRTANYGTPTGCSVTDKRGWYITCGPLSGCQMPLPVGTPGRTHSGFITDIYAGVAISQERKANALTGPNRVISSNFSRYNYECSKPGTTAAFITTSANLVLGQSFNPHFNISGLKFFDSNPVWFPPQIAFYEPTNKSEDTGEVSDRYVFQDLDGSIVGSPGSIVANNPNLLPPGDNPCTFVAKSNAYLCPGACYRAVRIFYLEPGFEKSNPDLNQKADYSYLRVTRVVDGKTVESVGNLNDPRNSGSVAERIYTLNLLAGYTYTAAIVTPLNKPTFFPTLLKVSYLDDVNSCNTSISVRFQPPPVTTMQYFADEDALTGFWRMCNGGTPRPVDVDLAQFGFTCVSQKAYMEVLLPPFFDQKVTLLAKTSSQACPAQIRCSIMWDGEPNWLWDASGLERRPNFYLPNASTSTFNMTGIPPYGYNNVALGFYVLPKPSPTLITYYFRKTFALADTACFSALYLQLFAKDGGVLYLNGNEFYRFNMPTGPVNFRTGASAVGKWKLWSNTTLAVPGADRSLLLQEGTNTFAAEIHVINGRSAQFSFDIRMFGIRKAVCSGAARY